jgi:hypothetical protein
MRIVLLLAALVTLLLPDLRCSASVAADGGNEVFKTDGELVPVHIHKVPFKTGMTYTMDMIAKTQGFDPYLRLEDENGKRLAQDDDSGGGLNARIVFRCEQAGTYKVIAAAYQGAASGKYELTLRENKSAPLAVTKLPLKDGKVHIVDKLTVTDPRDRVKQRSQCKLYSVEMTAGKTYQIDLQSSKFDSYLRLEDATGKELAHDDDGGGNRNARIIFNCQQNGTYRITATTFFRGLGEFTLSVEER